MESPHDLESLLPGQRQWSRRRMLGVGVPAVAAIVAVGAVPIASSRNGSPTRVGTLDTITTGPPTSEPELFSSVTRRVDAVPILPGSTDPSTSTTSSTTSTTTTTTIPPTTSPPTTTVPAQVTEPIAPPLDPRGRDPELRLGAIRIPKLEMDATMWEGIRLTTLDRGPGHWPGSAMPGQPGNVVIAGHRTSHGGVFRDIDQLVTGDTMTLSTDGIDVEYRATGTQIVSPDALWIVDPTPTPTATLFACHPPGSVRQRIVVSFELAS